MLKRLLQALREPSYAQKLQIQLEAARKDYLENMIHAEYHNAMANMMVGRIERLQAELQKERQS